METVLGFALRYAAAGIAVMPLHTPSTAGCSCRQRADCASPGKHPRLRHGVWEASTDARLIRWWWRRWPAANIGLATGAAVDVCDVDTRAGLDTVLDVLALTRPAGPMVRTGQGWHLWFASTGLANRIGFLPGVDWRGVGGSAVAPPSLHSSGGRYRFTQPWAPDTALPDCPASLRQLVAPPPFISTAATGSVTDVDRYAQAALDGEVARILAAPRPVIKHGERVSGGGRNNAVNIAAFKLGQLAARAALDQATVWSRLIDAAVAVGLRPVEARRTVASGWHAGLRRPRS